MKGSERYLVGRAGSLLWDISGAFGDIGILLPLAMVLVTKNGVNPTALFLMAGLFYILSAFYFKVTMPVQPLKAMSAIAIATGLSVEVINAAGILMGIILLTISVTGLSVKLGNLFPLSVIRGIQLGLGLMLIKTSSVLINSDVATAIIAGAILTTTIWAMKKIPPFIPLLLVIIVLPLKDLQLTFMGPMALTPMVPDMNNLWIGFIVLVLPQLGLTFGNAIVATEATGKLLYGKKAGRLSLKSIPASMGIANFISGIVGGVPMCHGSGGLTAHCKFGATSERSGYIIGSTLIVFSLLLGSSILSIVALFPKGILGILLCYVGIQHSFFIKDIYRDKSAMFVALFVATLGSITNNLTIGFSLGIGMHYVLIGFRKVIEYGKKRYIFMGNSQGDAPSP